MSAGELRAPTYLGASSSSPTLLMLDNVAAVCDANTKTALKRASLNSLLTTIAAYCPEGLFKTVLNDSTSISWIRQRLTQVCNIETSGRHLPKVLNIKFNIGEESPAAFLEKIKSFFMDSVMKHLCENFWYTYYINSFITSGYHSIYIGN